jgi:hypothetical protein
MWHGQYVNVEGKRDGVEEYGAQDVHGGEHEDWEWNGCHSHVQQWGQIDW